MLPGVGVLFLSDLDVAGRGMLFLSELDVAGRGSAVFE